MSKDLYILIQNMGDGSNSLSYSLDENVVDGWRQAYRADKLDYDAPGVDGDGFSVNKLQVPDDATYESLGIYEFQVLEPYVEEEL